MKSLITLALICFCSVQVIAQKDVAFKELSAPLDHRIFWDELEPLLPEKYSPINYNTHPREGYLFEVPDAMAALIFGNLIIDQLS